MSNLKINVMRQISKSLFIISLFIALFSSSCKKENKDFIGSYSTPSCGFTSTSPGHLDGSGTTGWFGTTIKAGSKGNEVTVDGLVGFNGLNGTIDGQVITVTPVNTIYTSLLSKTMNITSCTLTFAGTSFNFSLTANCIDIYTEPTTYVYTGSATKQ
jgi:hypothetical protein